MTPARAGQGGDPLHPPIVRLSGARLGLGFRPTACEGATQTTVAAWTPQRLRA